MISSLSPRTGVGHEPAPANYARNKHIPTASGGLGKPYLEHWEGSRSSFFYRGRQPAAGTPVGFADNADGRRAALSKTTALRPST